MRNTIGAIAVGLGVALSVIACQSSHGTHQNHHLTASQETLARKNAKALARCLPTGATQQIEMAHSLTAKSGRAAFAAKCGIPKAKRPAVEAELLNAAEHGHLTRHSGRVTFFEVTVPQIIERNQA